MAVTKTKRSSQPKQLQERKLPGRRFLQFPNIKGKTIDTVEFFTAADFHSITIAFQDKTALSLTLEPGFTIYPDYEDRKTGTIRLLKRWPPVQTEGWKRRR